jgi:hypothetical protein
MEKKTIKFNRPTLKALCVILPMIDRGTVLQRSPLRLPFGEISWDGQIFSITIKEGEEVPAPDKKRRSTTSGETLPGLLQD